MGLTKVLAPRCGWSRSNAPPAASGGSSRSGSAPRGDGPAGRDPGNRLTDPSHRGPEPKTEYYRYAGVGLQFAGTFLVAGALGWWLDGKLGTSPWLLLVGIFLGAAGGFTSLVLRVAPPTKKEPPNTPPPPPQRSSTKNE